ncbi:MAG: 4'-phosphopantetheinyl transferase superfamily protein [Blautia sp.]|nr:4'-phosphopantetheinyl transferase superfamily protein [Blautia sp.]
MHKGVIYFTEINEQKRTGNPGHIAGQKLLKYALWEEYQIDLGKEETALGEYGKPYLKNRPDIHFNITHSGKYAACILADQEVGIDIQKHEDRNMLGILRLVVPEKMIREILDGPDPEKAFYVQWVLREAYIKWTGEGLQKDMRTIPMEQGTSLLLDLEDGYSGAVWSEKPMEIEWKHTPLNLLDSDASSII